MNKMKLKSIIVHHLMLIAVALIFASNFVVGKTLIGIPPVFIGMARFLVAGIIYLPFLIVKRKQLPHGKVWIVILIMGFTGVFLFNPIIYFGLHYTTSINATLINSFNPMVIAFLSSVWLKEKISWPTLTGLITGFFGICFIVGRGSFINILKLNLNPGDLIIFLTTFIWATYTILIRKTMKLFSPVIGTMLATMTGLLFLIPAAVVENIWLPLPPLNAAVIISLIYLGIFPSVIAFLFWNAGVSKVGPAQAGVYYNLIPVFNFLLASQLLNEQIRSYHVIGGLITLIGILISQIKFRSQHKEKEVKPINS